MMNSSTRRSPLYYDNTKVIKEHNEEERGEDRRIKPNAFRESSSTTTTDASVTTMRRSAAIAKEEAPVSLSSGKKQSFQDINESADAFIKKFRQQLVIQRLESIENYEKMLARGT